ncbi:LuxR C-terminal-related transcriptional regulator [Marinobacter sp. VGCF2001]|uniref:LuxR C-terminal-related transcriptional regulator n=1 Tax=Marinobacter sp. VGCF2001 TaxID=3417189 RepID=UPI003CF51DF9
MSGIPESASRFETPAVVGGVGTDYADTRLSPVVSSMVAETKLTRPGLSPGLLLEPARLKALDCIDRVPFVLVSAPAGFGKTTLVSQWLDQEKPVYAWLTLDPRDNSPALFWNAIASALARVDPRFAIRESTLLTALEPGAVADPATMLINRLADYSRTWQAPGRLILVLDDFHLMDQSEVLQQVRQFIDFAPGLLRIVCISRVDPPIRTAQLLARQQMVRLGPEVLGFDLALTRKFVQARRADLSEAQMRQLHQRTGGWPAVLQLSALSENPLGAGPEPGQSALGDYLFEEVFAGLEPGLRSFLQDMSLLPLFSRDIADIARARDDSEQWITAMRERNLLFQRYGDTDHWYRLHDLLMDWLQRQERSPEWASAVRLRAAEAFRQRGLVVEALELFLSEDSFEQGEALVPALLQVEQLNGYRALPARFPDRIRLGSPALRLMEALFAFMDGYYNRVLDLLSAADNLLQAADSSPETDALGFVSMLLRWPSARFAGREAEADHSLKQIQNRLTHAPAGLQHWGRYTLGTEAFMEARLEPAHALLAEALAGALRSADYPCALRCLVMLVPVLIQSGRIGDARRCYQQTSARLETGSGGKEQMCLLAYLEGLLALECHDLSLASQRLDEANQFAESHLTPLDQLYLAFERFRLGMFSGDSELWQRELGRIEQLHRGMGQPLWHHNIPRPEALEALARLAEGSAFPLMVWAQSEPEPIGRNRFCALNENLLRRVGQLLAARPVAEELSALRAEAEKAGLQQLVCRLDLVTLMVQAFGDQDLRGAVLKLDGLLALWVPRGLVRPFVDADPRLDQLLEACRAGTRAATEADRVLALRQAYSETGAAAGEPAPPQGPEESLSAREAGVLDLLAEGLSNKAISEQLGISVATVKSHLSNIYGKLQAGNRVQAVARARELGLRS